MWSVPTLSVRVCHVVSSNCALLDSSLSAGEGVVLDLMKWQSRCSHDLEIFAGQLHRLEKSTKWLLDSYSLLCLLLDQLSSIYSNVSPSLLHHVHFLALVKRLGELVLAICKVKNALSQNRFIIMQLNKLKQLTQTAKKTENRAGFEIPFLLKKSVSRILAPRKFN